MGKCETSLHEELCKKYYLYNITELMKAGEAKNERFLATVNIHNQDLETANYKPHNKDCGRRLNR
jgi:hypothetical protein